MIHHWPDHPLVYEINTAVWLCALGQRDGRTPTLEQVPDRDLQTIADQGFDAVWLMGVWQRSPSARRIARQHTGLQEEYRRALPDFDEADVIGSPYAVHDYQVEPAFGGDKGLAQIRQRLRRLGLGLILDFVPNHLAIDHPWVEQCPERFVSAEAEPPGDVAENYFRNAGNPPSTLAHGRDPNYAGWSDTVQLDYRRAATRRVMTDTLLSIAARCDGVRCDMAMLVTRDVFLRTWGGSFDPPLAEFWPAAITDVKAQFPGFLMMAEAYWDLEWELQQQGFDYTYDKRLYDHLVHRDAGSLYLHLLADPGYQRHLVRFVENHDEPRAAASFPGGCSIAAALLTLTLPGLRLVHQGQIEGSRIKLPVQLGRAPVEPLNQDTMDFYQRLLPLLREPVFHQGDWKLLETHPAWNGNREYRGTLAHSWTLGQEIRLIAVNLSGTTARLHVALDNPALAGHDWQLDDLMHGKSYVRDGNALCGPGLYAELPPYGYHLFRFQRT